LQHATLHLHNISTRERFATDDNKGVCVRPVNFLKVRSGEQRSDSYKLQLATIDELAA
jgi:hypothetical protein